MEFKWILKLFRELVRKPITARVRDTWETIEHSMQSAATPEISDPMSRLPITLLILYFLSLISINYRLNCEIEKNSNEASNMADVFFRYNIVILGLKIVRGTRMITKYPNSEDARHSEKEAERDMVALVNHLTRMTNYTTYISIFQQSQTKKGATIIVVSVKMD